MTDKNMRMKLKVEVTHKADGDVGYEELMPCCMRIARHRGPSEHWFDVIAELIKAAETGDTIQTAFATYRLVVEVWS
jgi:effector-binding domain-containing protein